MSSFSLEYPYVLLILTLFVFSAFLFKKEKQSYYIPYMIEYLPAIDKKKYLHSILKWIAIISAVVALSSPTITQHSINKEAHSMDIVLNIDTSGSMSLNGFNRLDYKQNRFDVVRDVVEEFIHKRDKDRIGLVLFGDTSSIASPLSYNSIAPLSVIKQIQIGILGKSTALIDSIVSATELLKNSFSSSKIIILLTDGEDTASKIPLEIALKIAKKYKIKIYTIAIDETNNNILQIISKETNAKSFQANNKKDLHAVYESITKLEATTYNTETIAHVVYLYSYFLYLALFCGILLAFLSRNSEEL